MTSIQQPTGAQPVRAIIRRTFDLPKMMDRENAAAYCALSNTTMEKLVREKTFPAPRLLAGRRVGWLVRELNEWAESRPVSTLLPPRNTGFRKGG